MVVHLLMIANTSGSLTYAKVFHEGGFNTELLTGDWPVMTASVIVTYVMGMSRQVSPVADPAEAATVELIEGHGHNLHCHATATGNTFMFFTDTVTVSVADIFADVYVAFVDYVLKHPMYLLDASGAGVFINAAKYDVFSARLEAIMKVPGAAHR
jgi:hypothetical protein